MVGPDDLRGEEEGAAISEPPTTESSIIDFCG
jgi:hypothetical protein